MLFRSGYNPWIFDLFPRKDADYDEEAWTNQYELYGTNLRAAYRARFASGGVVPNVVGKTQAEATAAITYASLEVSTVKEEASNTVDGGKVISQHPSAGTQVILGSKVGLVFSKAAGASGGSERGASSKATV